MTTKSAPRAQHRPVKRLLRRRDTQEYVKPDGWTTNPDEAQSFTDVVEIAQFCAQRGLSGVEMSLRVDGGVSDVFCTAIR